MKQIFLLSEYAPDGNLADKNKGVFELFLRRRQSRGSRLSVAQNLKFTVKVMMLSGVKRPYYRPLKLTRLL